MFSNLLVWYFKYIPGRMRQNWGKFYRNIGNFFSPVQLLASLFMPWKRDEGYLANPTLSERFNLLVFNLISRMVGFSIRSLALVTLVVLIIAVVLIAIIGYLFWFSLPILSLLSFIRGWFILI